MKSEKKKKTKTMMHPHNLSHLTLRICISRGVRHTSQRSATSPSPFIIILIEFFFTNPILYLLTFRLLVITKKKKKKRKNVSNPTNPLRFQLSSTAIRAHIALPLRFSSMFDGYAVFYLVMFILSLYHHVISAREMIREAMRSRKKKKKKKKERKKK